MKLPVVQITRRHQPGTACCIHQHVKFNSAIDAVSIDEGGARVVAPFLSQNHYTFPVLIDSKMELFSKLGLAGTPATIIVDAQGKIVATSLGPVNLDSADLHRYIDSLVERK